MFRLAPMNRNQLSKGMDDMNFFGTLFDDFFNNGFFPKNELNTTSFRVDVKEREAEYVIEAELPGIEKKDIQIDYDDNRLYIRVEKNEEKEEKGDAENYLRRERFYSKMERAFYVKDIQGDKIEAKLENGILSITAPKQVLVDTKHRIEIQ